jgi:hypothetical protein
MLKITIIPLRGDEFHCAINLHSNEIKTNVKLENIFSSSPPLCRRCYDGKFLNNCNLLNALLPFIVYFSNLVSHEQVTIIYEENNYYVKFTETAQRAGFVLSLYLMFHSHCQFFSRFEPFLRLYRVNITHKIFLHLILSTALIKRQIDFKENHEQIDLFAEVKDFAKEVKERLLFIFNDAKILFKKDAAVNSLNIIFAASTLSADGLQEFYQELIRDINDAPVCDEIFSS